MVERKAFLANPKHHIVYPNEGEMIVMPITKGMDFILGIQLCLISWMNFDYKENGGKKCFSYKSKPSISCTAMSRA